MAENFNEEDGVWRTVSGRRIFIRNGETLSQAMAKSGKFNNVKKTNWEDQWKKLKAKYPDAEEEEGRFGKILKRYHVKDFADEGSGFYNDITQQELDENPCKLIIYGQGGEHSEYIYENRKALMSDVKESYGGFSQMSDLKWSIQSAAGKGEFYLERDKYSSGGWTWKDSNDMTVKGGKEKVSRKLEEYRNQTKMEKSGAEVKPYEEWSSDEKKKFRAWYRRHNEEFAEKHPDIKDADELKKLAQEDFGKRHGLASETKSEDKVETKETKETKEPKSQKEKQFEIVQKANPMTDDYHTGIRSVDDIKTFQEALDDDGYDGGSLTPDYGEDKVEKAKETGVITVYSSKPIENGNFVTPSKMEAESYAGSGQVYSKEVKLEDVAWIDPLQGQYAKSESVSDRIKKQREKSKEPEGTKTLSNPEEYLKGTFDNETKTYTTPNGHKVSMLNKKDYSRLCQEQLEKSSEETKGHIGAYTMSQSYAYSADLNSLTPERIAQGRGTQYRITDDKNLTCTPKEFDEIKDAMWKSWLEDFKGSESGYADDMGYEAYTEAQKKWREKWNVQDMSSPREYKPSDYYPRMHWTNDEIEEAKAIAKALKEVEDKHRKIYEQNGYDREEDERYSNEHKAIIEAATHERLKASTNRSAFFYEEIANYNTTRVYKPGLAVKNNPNIKEMNVKDILETDWDEKTLNIQPSSIQASIRGIKNTTRDFDEAFERDGITLDHDIMLFRRSHESNRDIDEGFTRLGYTSTTAKDTLPKKMPSGVRFGDQEYYIVVPAGTKMLFAEDVIGYDKKSRKDYVSAGYEKADKGIKRQHEVILPRNAHFTKLAWDPSTGAYIMRVDWEKGEKKNG